MEADTLSRIDWGKDDQTLPAESIQAIVILLLLDKGRIILILLLAVPKLLSPLPHLYMIMYKYFVNL